jgi:ribosomal protein L20A (L18A)
MCQFKAVVIIIDYRRDRHLLSTTGGIVSAPRIKMFIRALIFTRQGDDAMKAYQVVGKIEIERRVWQKFSKEIAAADEKKAKEKIFCDFGSRQGKKRRSIEIKSVTEIVGDKVIDSVVRHQIGAK